MKKLLILLTFTLMSAYMPLFVSCAESPTSPNGPAPAAPALGVWWWHTSLRNGPHLDFAVENGVTEIYYQNTTFHSEHGDFIERAYEKGIKVYWLQGRKEYIYDDAEFRTRYGQYLAYQAAAPLKRRFAGIHLDVEPHGYEGWNDNREELTDRYLTFVTKLRDDFPNEHFDFDIPFWFNDPVTYRGAPDVPLYKAVMGEANRTFIMSYRPSAEQMYNLGTVPEQIEYAKSLGKPVFLCAEADYEDDDINSTKISYRSKGKDFMMSELGKLRGMANYDKLGIAIHDIQNWYNLQP